jgi:hypothetical protein
VAITATGKSSATATGEVAASVEAADAGLRTAKSAPGGRASEAATVEAASSHTATKAAATPVTTTAATSTAPGRLPHVRRRVLRTGLNASPGVEAVRGQVCFFAHVHAVGQIQLPI